MPTTVLTAQSYRSPAGPTSFGAGPVTTALTLGGGALNTATTLQAAAAGTINVGENTVVQTTNVGSTNGASATTVRSGTGGLAVTATGSTLALAATGANNITFATNGTTRGRFENRSLALGETAIIPGYGPAANIPLLTYTGSATSDSIQFMQFNNAAGACPAIVLIHGGGSPSAPTATQSGDVLGYLFFDGVGSSTVASQGALISAVATAAHTATTWGGALAFSTSLNGAGALSVRWRIEDTGALSGRSAGSQITWTTGLGAINHVVGPTDQELRVSAGAARNLALNAPTGQEIRLQVNSVTNATVLGGSFQSNVLFQTVATLSTAYGTSYNHQNHDPAAFAADVGGGTGYSGLVDGVPTVVVFASIRGQKENGTSGNQLGYCAIRTNIGGGNTAEGVRWDSAQNTRIPSGSVTGFSSSATNAAAIDTGFSRVSAGIAALGNGTATNATGTLRLASIIALGTNQVTVADGAITQSAGGLTVTATGAILSLDGSGIETSAPTITADAGLAIATTTTGVLSLDSGTTGAVNLGTGANAKTVTIGNVTTTTSVVLNAGTGGIDLNATGAGGITLDAGATGAFSIDGFASSNVSTTSADLTISTLTSGILSVTSAGALTQSAAGAVTINSTGSTIGIGDGADAFAINIGTGAAARTITIGNTTASTAVAINAPTTGTINLSAGRVQSNSLPIPVVLAVVSADLAAVGTTNLYTVPASRTAIITDVVIKPTTATAAVGDAAAGIGVAAGEDDVFASQVLTGLNLTTERFKFLSSGVSRVAAAADVIKIGVDTADTGTALVADVYLIGYLI